MKATTMLDTLASMLGRPACAIPLSLCKPSRSYLLNRAGIPPTGTALLFTIPYLMTSDVDDPTRNLSLYAVSRDYHGYMQNLRETVLPALHAAFPGYTYALFSDHSPLSEVDAAARAGLGVRGHNGLLITSDFGSFVFIGEVITDADYEAVTGQPVPAFTEEVPRCEGCGACLRACPARRDGAWISPCISELTQKKGVLTSDELTVLKEHPLVWGCDVCQTVCPHNRRVLNRGVDTPIRYFQEERLLHISRDVLENMSDQAFFARAYSWRGRGIIARNCQIKEEMS